MSMPASNRRGPRVPRPLLARWRFLLALAVGLAVWLLGGHWLARGVTRALVGWDLGVCLFAGLCFAMMCDTDHDRMRRRAIEHDGGNYAFLAIAVMAAVASIVAIAMELGEAKGHGQAGQVFVVALTVATISLAWFFVHLVFTVHYAHVYYVAESADGGGHRGGLDFPDDDPPDYWDFLYFAVVMGATAQTADVSIVSKEMRRVATGHSLISFTFNTAILATMINLAAGLF